MLTYMLEITQFIIEAFMHIWPYLLITIPLAVAIRLSGASNYIKYAFDAQPLVAIVLATAVGAFSPFCSCGVIPVIATLLISGVPLAPVMSFWLASPLMDPETFFLSVSTLGWQLAVWRLAGTLILSLSAGFITHFVMQKEWLGQNILRQQHSTATQSSWTLLKNGGQAIRQWLTQTWQTMAAPRALAPVVETACCPSPGAEIALTSTRQPATEIAGSAAISSAAATSTVGCGCGSKQNFPAPVEESSCRLDEKTPANCETDKTDRCNTGTCGINKPASFWQRLWQEAWAATTMVAKFMLLTFFLEAIIILYIPSEWIAQLLGQENEWAILAAALLGVPVYTSNLSAMPLVSGLLAQGMNPGAGLAFLIAGPATTIPAMAAVWGLVSRRVFVLYVSFSLIGAVVLGYAYVWFSPLF